MDTDIDPRWGSYSPVHDPRILANFQPRPSDVLITTAPKAGTTWMQQILHQLRSGGDSSFTTIDAVVPWLERPREGLSWEDMLKRYDGLANPRIFKTHCTYPQTPGADVVRIILSSRDPRDCCVSFYHHLMDMTDDARSRSGHDAPDSFDTFFDRWIEFGAWFRNVKSWWPQFENDNVLWLRYQDMKHDLNPAIDSILGFLNWNLSQSDRGRVLEYCSFDWMKTHTERFSQSFDSRGPIFKPGGFIRKGTVGDYKKLLSPDQERRIFDKARRELEPECLDFLAGC